MQTLSSELRGVLSRRVQAASAGEILRIASVLSFEEAVATPPTEAKQTISFRIGKSVQVREDVVCDNVTGLMWTRGNVGNGRMNWKDAQDACSKVTLGGFSDWRLPTIQELLSLVDYERHNPAIDTSVFECEPSWYWSSTVDHEDPSVYAWFVDFGGGSSFRGNRYDYGFVRAVRVGQF